MASLLHMLMVYASMGFLWLYCEGHCCRRLACVCLQEFVTGLRSPVVFEASPDGSRRVFIGERLGIIHIFNKNGVPFAEPFLDISNKTVTSNDIEDNRGLIAFTFHPSYAQNRKFYLAYSLILDSGQLVTRLSEFHVSLSNGNKADMASERVLLDVPQPARSRKGSTILFGIDSFLYIFLGDGGITDEPPGVAQNKTSLLGKILRIDVNSPSDPGLQYKIPVNNPFVGEQNARGEIFALGFRNPFKCSIDKGNPLTGLKRGRIFCGDLGEDRFEEVDIIEAGGNYGWNLREGFECFQSSPCDQTGPQVLPIHAYSRDVGIGVIGGFVYRGCKIRPLRGKYIYGDFLAKMFSLEETRTGWVNRDLAVCDADVCRGGLSSQLLTFIFAFGQDDKGELYVISSDGLGPEDPSKIYKLVNPVK